MHVREASVEDSAGMAHVQVDSSRLGRCTRTELLDGTKLSGAGPVEVAYGWPDIEGLYK